MRIKRGVIKKPKHKKLLKAAKGYRMSYSKNYRRAIEAVMHADQYSFAHRRRRPSQMRNENIKTLSAALSEHSISYSKFAHNLKIAKVSLDRKILAHMANFDIESFKFIVESTQK
jgi:large subunit ribosomal protein L20